MTDQADSIQTFDLKTPPVENLQIQNGANASLLHVDSNQIKVEALKSLL